MIERTIERLQLWCAWKAPKWLVYWCLLRVGAYATTGRHSDIIVPELTFMDAVKRWGDR